MTTKSPMNALWHNFFKPQDDWIEDTAKLCEKNLLFKGFSPAVIRWFAAKMHPREYKAGENVFHAGDEGAGAILLRSGSISISNNGVQLATIQAGDMFGEVALVDGQARTADAVAVEPCELVFLLRTDLNEWANSHPKHACILLKNLGAMLAGRLLESNKNISNIVVQESSK